MTAFYAVLDPVGRTLTYARAGHNPPRLVRGDRILALDQASGLPLGIADEQKFDHACQELQANDLLLLYTDGVTEAFAAGTAGSERELFGVERLDDVLLKNRGCSSDECIAKIRQSVAEFAGNNSPNDDQTLIAIRCE